MNLSLAFFVVLIFLSAAGANAVSVANDFSCTRVPIVKAVTPPSNVPPQRSGFLFDTYSGQIDVLGSDAVPSVHDKSIAGPSRARIEVSSHPGESLRTPSPNFASDLTFMELGEKARGHPVRFDFANNQPKLADAPASVSIAIVDSPTISFASLENIIPRVNQLIIRTTGSESAQRTQSFNVPIESVNPGLSLGAEADQTTAINALVPEAGAFHYGLLGICLLLAKFRWDGLRDRRKQREMNRRDAF
jgi:hypothetical protein